MRQKQTHNAPCLAFGMLFIAGLLFIFAYSPRLAAETEESTKTADRIRPTDVLILHSYHKGYPFTDQETKGIDEVLKSELVWINVYTYYLESKRENSPEYFYRLKEFFKPIFEKRRYAAVLVTDDDALRFAIKYRTELFPDVPIVFCGITDTSVVELKEQPKVTGIFENPSIKETIELAERILPKVKSIFVISDGTTTGVLQTRLTRSIEKEFRGRLNFEYVSLADYSMSELLKRLSVLGPEYAVLLLQHYKDKLGQILSHEGAIRLIVQSTQAPVFVVNDIRLVPGVVGGKVLSGFEQGRIAASLLLRILKGEPVESIPMVFDSENKYVVDYSELKKRNIPSSLLPSDARVLNEPFQVFYKYKTFFVSILSVFFVLLSLVLILALSIFSRKQAEKALRQSEEKYRTLFEKMEQGVVYQDANGQIFSVNPAAERFLGLTKDELMNKTSLDSNWQAIHEDETPFPGNEHPAMVSLRTGEPKRNVVMGVVHPKESQYRWALMSSTPQFRSGESKPYQVFVTITDITEIKKAEENLKTKEYQFASLFEHMTEGVALHKFMLDESGYAIGYRIIDVNPQYEKTIGICRENVIGKRGRDVYQTSEEPYLDIYWSAYKSGKNARFESYFEPLDKTFYISVAPLPNNEFATIFFDITDRKKAEAEHKRLEEQLRQAHKMEAVGQLAGGIAHDLNNMLSPILGYAEMLLLDVKQGTKEHDHLIQIERAASRAKDLTQQLLAFGRKQLLELRACDLNDVISNFQKILSRTIREDIEMKLDLMSAPAVIKADVGQLEQVLLNLALNAQDAMAKGGTLCIKTEYNWLDAKSMDFPTTMSSGEYVVLTVSDTGVGVRQEHMERLFEPFFTTKEKGKGVGLGLATVYGIVRQHGGDVKASSVEGQGTTFRLYFPKSSDAATQKEPESRVSLKKAEGETILVAEDDAMVRTLAAQILKSVGYNVLVADSATAAIELCASNRIDLLLTDVVMPQMNGRELHAKLMQTNPEIQVVYMSGYTGSVIAQRGVLEEGMNFVQKPFSIEALTNKIDQVLKEKKGL